MTQSTAPKYFIYGLRDPRTSEIRYVGQTSRGMIRPRNHRLPSNLRTHSNLHSVKWIQKLQNLGLDCEIVVLEVLHIDHLPVHERSKVLNETETRWVAIGRAALGKRLTNRTEGGGGILGHSHSLDTIAKMSETHRKAATTPEGRARLEAATAACHTQEVYDKIAEAHRIRLKLPKEREKILRAVAAAKTPEALSKLSISLRSFAQTPEGAEVRAANSARRKEEIKTPEGRAHMLAIIEKAHMPESIKKCAEKQSKTKKAIAQTPEGRAVILAVQAKSQTEEAIAKATATRRALAQTPEGKARLDALNRAARTPEALKKQAEGRKRWSQSPEGKAHFVKMSEAARVKRLDIL